MSNASSDESAPRVLFFGMVGIFSTPALATLLESGVDLCAVIIPASPVPGSKPPPILPILQRQQPRARRASLPLVNLAPSIIEMAWTRHVPVWEVARLAHPDTLALLAAYQPDIICVACFSQRIPRVILDLPPLGCLNVHPSLLPANRGPVPLFWTFREGHAATGVTIHLLDTGMDSGDILAQEPIAVPDGITYEQLEVQCATRGGPLLAATVWNLHAGRATRTPQDEAHSSYHSFPHAEDFTVPAHTWSARHAYNFIHGLSTWDQPVILLANDQLIPVRDTISYSLISEGRSGEDRECGEGEMDVVCCDGCVRVRVS